MTNQVLGPVRFLKGPTLYTRTPDHQPLSEFYITLPELPSHAEVLQAVPENPTHSNGERRNDPLWAVVCVVLGTALLVASGAFLIITEVLR